ncbi:hypothetical protein Tco_0339387, partial [Tanacetum coccineum]
MLEVTSWKEVVHFGKKEMLAPRYVGPFEIIKGSEVFSGYKSACAFEEKMSTQTHHNDEEPVEISSVSLKDLKRSSSGNPIMTLDEYSKRGPKNHRDNVRSGNSTTAAMSQFGYQSIERDHLMVIEVMVVMGISFWSHFSDNENDGTYKFLPEPEKLEVNGL